MIKAQKLSNKRKIEKRIRSRWNKNVQKIMHKPMMAILKTALLFSEFKQNYQIKTFLNGSQNAIDASFG